jgi:prophage antirepressor-like protein
MSHLPAIFNYQDHQIRTFVINDEIYFVVVDVCRVLEIVNTTNAIDRLDPDGVRQAEVIDSLGRKQTATIANEPNLYRLIFRSDKPEAKAFQDWVYHEVLPSIRKTGNYSASQESPNIAEIRAAYEGVLDAKEHLTEATDAYREAQARFNALIEPLGELGKILTEQVSGQRFKPTPLATTRKPKLPTASEEDKKSKLTERVLVFLRQQKEPVSRRTVIQYATRNCVPDTQAILDELMASGQVTRTKVAGSKVQWFYQASEQKEEV